MPLPSLSRLVASLVFCLLPGAVDAQRPVVVVGGPSPQFPDLPAAVAAAPAGAILLVHPGVYTGFTTNKPLRIHLAFDAAGGVIQPAPGSAYTIAVAGLPAGDEFVVLGHGALILPGSVGALRVVNSAATVLLEGITVAASGQRSALDVQLSTGVHVRRCVLGGTPAVAAQYTNFCASECVLLSTLGASAIAYETRFSAARTFFTGTSQPALRLIDCVAQLASDGTSPLSVLGPPGVPIAAIEATGGALQFDPASVGLLPNGSAPGCQAVGTLLLLDEVPTLTASPAPPGQVASVRMTCSVPRLGAIVFGQLLDSPGFFGLANLWVDTLAGPIVVAGGVCDPSGLAAQVPIPSSPALHGEAFALQGMTFLPNGWPVLSAPGLWILL